MREVRHSRFECFAAAALLWLLPATSLAVGPAKFSCPPGTQVEKRPHFKDPVEIELCRDLKTGFREGPYRVIARNGLVTTESNYRGDKLQGETRIYDDQGRLTHVVQYANGQEISTRLTRAGMENTFRMLNEKFRKNGHAIRLVVRDEQTVEYNYTTSTRFTQPAQDEKLARERLVAEGSMCKAFAAFSNVQTLIARYADEDGNELLVVPVRRADCEK